MDFEHIHTVVEIEICRHIKSARSETKIKRNKKNIPHNQEINHLVENRFGFCNKNLKLDILSF